MRLVVGLGNPGRKYEGTRHNVGYVVLAEFARRVVADPAKSAFQGEIREARLADERLLLLWPHTYMNLSGASVLAARDFYKLENSEILIVCDDFNLDLGTLRFRAKGSSGGQKGLADIVSRLGTEEVPRLRIGIGPVPERWDAADFVLGRFAATETKTIEETIPRAVQGVEDWIRHGLAHCTNHYN